MGFTTLISITLAFCTIEIQGHRLPRSCSDLKSHMPAATDGEYWLTVTQDGATGAEFVMAKIYCGGMETCMPQEYITLVKENYAVSTKERINDSGPTDTCRYLGDIYTFNEHGTTTFRKVAVDVDGLIVNKASYDYADTTGLKEQEFGRSGDCYSDLVVATAPMVVDFRETGLSIHSEVTWTTTGWMTEMKSFSMTADRQRATAKCGGWFGHCQVQRALKLTIYPEDKPPEDSAIFVQIQDDDSERMTKFALTHDSFRDDWKSVTFRCVRECSSDPSCVSTEYDAVSDRCIRHQCDESVLRFKKYYSLIWP